LRHNEFIRDTEKCWSYHNKRQEEIEELNYRFKTSSDLPNCVKPTESSKAKMKIDDSAQQKPDTKSNTEVKTSKRKKALAQIETDQTSILSILSKSPIDRTREEVQQGFRILKILPALSHLSDFIITQIINVATLVNYEEASIVFRQGEEGTAWYVILDGGVNIFVSPPEYMITHWFSELDNQKNSELILKNSKRVAHLEKGFGFGELAMINDAVRAASVITTAPTKLLKMEKRDYVRILKSIHDQEIRSKVLFLKKLSIISDLITLKNLASVFYIFNTIGYGDKNLSTSDYYY
jgi:cAMP-dependent protein kinase regulator